MDKDNVADITCSILGLCIFMAILIFTTINVVRYWRHRNFSLSLFYSLCILGITSRIIQYILTLTSNQLYWYYMYFGILPAYLLVSMGIS